MLLDVAAFCERLERVFGEAASAGATRARAGRTSCQKALRKHSSASTSEQLCCRAAEALAVDEGGLGVELLRA